MLYPSQLAVESRNILIVPWQSPSDSLLGMAEYLARSWGLTIVTRPQPRLIGAAPGASFFVELEPHGHVEGDRDEILDWLANDFVAAHDLHPLLQLAVNEGKLAPGSYLILNRRDS